MTRFLCFKQFIKLKFLLSYVTTKKLCNSHRIDNSDGFISDFWRNDVSQPIKKRLLIAAMSNTSGGDQQFINTKFPKKNPIAYSKTKNNCNQIICSFLKCAQLHFCSTYMLYVYFWANCIQFNRPNQPLTLLIIYITTHCSAFVYISPGAERGARERANGTCSNE